MHIDLREIPVGIISLAKQERRRNRAIAMAESLGLKYQIIEGIADTPRHAGCSQSHRKAIETLRGRGHFMVLEDDAVPTADYRTELVIPSGADLLYLGHSPLGFSPRLNQTTSELTEYLEEGYLRVHSMLAAHSIVYLSDNACGSVLDAINSCLEAQPPRRHDLGLCAVQQQLTVAAVDRPFFVQSAEVQGKNKRALRAGQQDFRATPRQVGDRVEVNDLTLVVKASDSGRLEFASE